MPFVTDTSARRRLTGEVETRVVGRVTAAIVQRMVADYLRLGGGARWFVDASETHSYAPEAIGAAVTEFAKLAAGGLREIVAFIKKPLVRMGAHTVGMSLAAARVALTITVVESREAFATTA